MPKTLSFALLLIALAGTLILPQAPAMKSAGDSARQAALAPVYAIAGTDSQALAREVAGLAEIQKQLVAQQESPADQSAVSSLYPIRFLAALARAEEKRKVFIASPSRFARESYLAALSAVAIEKQFAVTQFGKAWITVLGTNQARVVTFGGSIDTYAVRASLSRLADGMLAEQEKLTSYARCLRGGGCGPPAEPATSWAAEIAPKRERGTGTLWREVYGTGGNSVYVSFTQSTCLATQPAPYLTLLTYSERDGVRRPSLRYADDIFFAPTNSGKTPLLSWEREHFGIQYSPINPFNFYICPEAGIDLSEALTAHAAMTQEVPAEELALMRSQKTAGLEFLVHDMVRILTGDLRGARTGVPFDFSAKRLFLAYSAFPSLFHIGSESDWRSGLRRLDSADQAAFFSNITTYSALEKTVPRETILHDLRSFVTFENSLVY